MDFILAQFGALGPAQVRSGSQPGLETSENTIFLLRGAQAGSTFGTQIHLDLEKSRLGSSWVIKSLKVSHWEAHVFFIFPISFQGPSQNPEHSHASLSDIVPPNATNDSWFWTIWWVRNFPNMSHMGWGKFHLRWIATDFDISFRFIQRNPSFEYVYILVQWMWILSQIQNFAHDFGAKYPILNSMSTSKSNTPMLDSMSTSKPNIPFVIPCPLLSQILNFGFNVHF